jgi:TonB family protein
MKHCVAFTLAIFLSFIPCQSQTATTSEENASNSGTKKLPDTVEILTDTQGVDFRPYVLGIIHSVSMKWYGFIPDEARVPQMKQGDVDVEFQIDKRGVLSQSKITKTSGDKSLDDACSKAVLEAAPFNPLPSEFNGEGVLLRFHFRYNPARKPKP